MSSSTPAPRFLLDENVRAELDVFLKEVGYAVKRLGNGAPDRSLLTVSREGRWVIVTNDEDFASAPASKAFAVVLLRIPQAKVGALRSAFRMLLSECRAWKGRVIVLTPSHWKATPLAPKRQRGRKQKSPSFATGG